MLNLENPRWLGVPAIALFAWHLRVNQKQGTLANMFWVCNISLFSLAIGLLTRQPLIIRISAMHLLAGIPPWVYNLVVLGERIPSSFASHIGGGVVAMLATSRIRMKRALWPVALLWFLVLQQFCRFLTPAALNVNMAHEPFAGDPVIFSSYSSYRMGITIAYAMFLWAAGSILWYLCPQEDSLRNTE